jgi:hypothetical protein
VSIETAEVPRAGVASQILQDNPKKKTAMNTAERMSDPSFD